VKHTILVILALLGFACSSPDYDLVNGSEVNGTPVYDDVGGIYPGMSIAVVSDFAPDQRAAFVSGLDHIARGTFGAVVLHPTIDGDDEGDVHVRPGKLSGKRGGQWERPELTVYIDVERMQSRSLDTWEKVFMHEVLHGLGLEHQATGIMSEVLMAGEPCLDELALTLLCELHGCPNGFEASCHQ
jgi:hypothetical protein